MRFSTKLYIVVNLLKVIYRAATVAMMRVSNVHVYGKVRINMVVVYL